MNAANEVMNEIHHLANERLSLYLLSSKQKLTPEQFARIHQITDLLPVKWDQYRREFAASRHVHPITFPVGREFNRKVRESDSEAA